jgi:hypothetical protein
LAWLLQKTLLVLHQGELSTGEKPLQVTTNQKERPVQRKRVPFWLKRALRLSLLDSGTLRCLLKKTSLKTVKVSAHDIPVTRPKINLVPDTGLVKRGNDSMKVEEVLAKLEKHEAECNLRYQRIEERLDEHKSSLSALDVKLWALAVLIIIAPFVQKFLG